MVGSGGVPTTRPDEPGFTVHPVTAGPFFTLGYRALVRGPDGAVWGHFRTVAEAQAHADGRTLTE